MPLLLERTRFVEDKDANGNVTGFRVEVINDKGTPRIGDTAGNPMTLDQLADEIYVDNRFSRAFEPTGNGGGGAAQNTSSQSGASTVSKRSEFKSPAERSAYIGEHGMDAYLNLPEK